MRERKFIVFTQSCSGCFETIEGHVPHQDGRPIYPYDEKAQCYVGAGCPECGYTGKRRTKILAADLDRELA